MTAYVVVVVLDRILRALPERTALRTGAVLGEIAGACIRGRRRDVLTHLRWAFPGKPAVWYRRMARAAWRHLGRELAATLVLSRLPSNELHARTRVEGMGLLDQARKAGRGVILITAHLGNWEIGSFGFISRGVPFDAVAKPLRNARVNSVLAATRERIGMGVIDVGAAVLRVPRALRAGRVVAIPSDQRAASGGILIPFFGREAATPKGAPVFADRLGAPILFSYALRNPGHPATYTVHFERLALDDGYGERDLLLAYHDALERVIRRVPDQYFWQHRRWKRRKSPARDAP